jgi:hypothetical protein
VGYDSYKMGVQMTCGQWGKTKILGRSMIW